MTTFYSVLYAILTPETAEKISLGILLSDGDKSMFRYSRSKFSALKEFIPDEQHRFIRNYLHSMHGITENYNIHKSKLFDEKEIVPAAVSESYVEYLSRYNQNVLTFGKPVNVNVPINESSLSNLFRVLINEKEIPTKYTKHKFQQIKKEFIPKVSIYYNSEREVLPEEYPGLIIPVKIDLFGKNEQPVFAQFVDFERPINHIKNEFYDLKQLQEVIKMGKGFIISTEPGENKYSIQHTAWEAIRKSKIGEYIDISEVEKVKVYAEAHGVMPF